MAHNIHSKSHVDYWKLRITKRGGSSFYSVRLNYKGHREWFNTGKSTKDAAAPKAREQYEYLKAHGWDATSNKYKHSDQARINAPTVGEFISSLRKYTDLKETTLNGYLSSFRKVIAHIAKIETDNTRFDYTGKNGSSISGNEKWKNRIDAIKLDRITPDKIQRWKLDFVKNAGDDQIRVRETKISADSDLRRIKALFSSKNLIHIEKRLSLPSTLPTDGVAFYNEKSLRYKRQLDFNTLLLTGKNDLASNYPEQFKILLLSFCAGLRRGEIDSLLWKSVDFENSVIYIERTKYWNPKTETSLRLVRIDPEVISILRSYKTQGYGEFVVNSSNPPRPQTGNYRYYRAQHEYDKLIVWLRNQGVPSKAPIHVLRKEYGSRIAETQGILLASASLGHSSVKTTERHYIDAGGAQPLNVGFLLMEETRAAS